METITITLAGQKYTIQPLTVGQLQDLHVGIVEPQDIDPKENTRKFWERNIETLAVALRDSHPELTIDVIRKMRLGSLTAVKEAVDEVLVFAGIFSRAKPIERLRAELKALQDELLAREMERKPEGEAQAGTE